MEKVLNLTRNHADQSQITTAGFTACVILANVELGWNRHIWDIPLTEIPGRPCRSTLIWSILILYSGSPGRLGNQNALRCGSVLHSPKPSSLLLPPHPRWQYEVISARHSCRIYLLRPHHAHSLAFDTGSMRVSTIDNISNSRSNWAG